MEEEIWKEHYLFNGYEFSNLGRYKVDGYIRNINQKNQHGYIKLKNHQNGKMYSFHRIIAELFCKKESNDKIIVDHINGLRDDNRADNLRWVTYSENNSNKRRDGIFATYQLKENNYKENNYEQNLMQYVKLLERLLEEKNKKERTFFDEWMEAEKTIFNLKKQLWKI